MKDYQENYEKRAEIIRDFIKKVEDEDIKKLLKLMKDATKINEKILKDEKDKETNFYANNEKEIEECIRVSNITFETAINCLYSKCERMGILKQESTSPRM